MIIKVSINLTVSFLLETIESLKNAELCRDFKASAAAFAPFWTDYDGEPELPPNLDSGLRAEILRLAGFYLSYSGKAQNIRNHQERGKDLLFQSIRIFNRLELRHKSAEASIMLALCYWYLGCENESADILDQTESIYENNRLHPVYLQLCINRLLILYRKDKFPYKESFDIIEKIKIPMEVCRDKRLQAMYHNQAGVFYQLVGRNDLASIHQLTAIDFSRSVGSRTYEGSNLNNLALVSNALGNIPDALEYANQALSIFETDGAIGWVAVILDTKAQILLNVQRETEALAAISEAIGILASGDAYRDLATAICLRVQIQLRLNNIKGAMLDFADLVSLSNLRFSQSETNGFVAEISKLLYVKKNLPFDEEDHEFKKHLIIEALLANDKKIGKSSESLGLPSHQNLSDKMRNQYPEIYELLDIPRPKGKTPKKGASKSIERHFPAAAKRPINLMNTQNVTITFPVAPAMADQNSLVFLLSAADLPDYSGLPEEMLILCRPKDFYRNEPVVVLDLSLNKFACARIRFDHFSGAYLLENFANAVPESLENYRIYGEIIGYVALDEASGQRIEFRALP